MADEVIHADGKPLLPCGLERVAGLLITGDPAQVTCAGCQAAAKKGQITDG